MIQNTKEFENGLNIHLLSFNLPEDIVKENEKIRVSITSVPEGDKQSFSIEKKEINSFSYIFPITATNNTTKIILVFRKQKYDDPDDHSYNPIIASTSIHINEFQNIPQSQITAGMMNTDIKNINIYYPLQHQVKEMRKRGQVVKNHMSRQVLGQVQVQLSFIAQYKNIKKFCPVNDYFNYSVKKNNNIPMKKRNGNGSEFEKLIRDDSFCNPYLQ